MRNRLFFLLVLLLFYFPVEVIAQKAAEPDSLTALNNTISFYRDQVKHGSFIYQGRQYAEFDHRINGHAYFIIKEWQEGNINYKGQHYQQVPMLYDVVNDEVLVKHYGGHIKVKLYKEKIDEFSLSGHHFIKLAATDTKGEKMPGGFYDQLYKGELQVLVKRKKIISEYHHEMKVKRDFVEKDLYFIQKDGVYYPVKKKGSVLEVLKNQKKEIRQFLKQNKIVFKLNPEFAIVKMVEFYDQNSSTK